MRDYLKKIWEENNNVHPVSTNRETVRNEAEKILAVSAYRYNKAEAQYIPMFLHL